MWGSLIEISVQKSNYAPRVLNAILSPPCSSLIEFFKKMKKWQEMTKLLHDFQKKIDTLERKFEVASIIFSKYHRVFHDLFSPLDEKPTAASRRGGRKKHGLVLNNAHILETHFHIMLLSSEHATANLAVRKGF